jgi:hypothetical protein
MLLPLIGHNMNKKAAEIHLCLTESLKIRGLQNVLPKVAACAVAPALLVDHYQHFGGPCCLHLLSQKLRAAGSSVALVNSVHCRNKGA